MADENMFPVMYGRSDAAGPLQIRWALAERAYAVYAAKYGKGQGLQRLAERGGFHAAELDVFIPGWRDDSAEFERRVAAAVAVVALIERLKAYGEVVAQCRPHNLNHRVEVVLTATGARLVREYYQPFLEAIPNDAFPIYTEGDTWRVELRVLMLVFGPHLRVGAPSLLAERCELVLFADS